MVRQIADLCAAGCEVIVVSSGSMAAGREVLSFPSLPKEIPAKQMLSAVGQPRLMAHYEELFALYGHTVAQVLLTRGDLARRRSYLNARNTLMALLDRGVVPIINLEWIQKIHRDRAIRGYSAETATAMILRRMPDYVHYICPQFSRTDINFQRVPTIDPSNPFTIDKIPPSEQSMIVIHIANGNAENVKLYGLRPGTHPAAGFGIFRVPTVAACMYLILGDISIQFPNLRWGFIEASSQWIPWIHQEATRRLHAAGKEIPDSLFEANNIFVTCQVDEDIPWIMKYAGDNCLVIGTDYGHNDPSSDIDALGLLRDRDDIDAETKERILLRNPSTLFGIDLAA